MAASGPVITVIIVYLSYWGGHWVESGSYFTYNNPILTNKQLFILYLLQKIHLMWLISIINLIKGAVMWSSIDNMPFTGSPERCQEESLPSLLLALVNMALEGHSIKDQISEAAPAALAISRMLKFNSVKNKRTCETIRSSVTVRNSVAQKTPVPIYI